MAKSRKKPRFPIISLSHLAEVAEVDYKFLYNNVAGIYNSIERDTKVRTQLVNAAFTELVPFFDYLGFELKMKKKPVEPKL